MTLSILVLIVVLAVVTAAVGFAVDNSLKAIAGKLHLLSVAMDGLHGPLGDVKRKQDEVLCEVTKYREDVAQLLKDIRDLNNTELTERKEILSRTNITGTSRVTSMRAWVANLETAAEKELIGLGSDR